MLTRLIKTCFCFVFFMTFGMANAKYSTTHSIDFGVEYYRYTEPNVMYIHGPMVSFYASSAFIKSLFRIQSDIHMSSHVGGSSYVGSFMDGRAYSAQSTDYYLNLAPKIGLNIASKRTNVAFLYVGGGYRILDNFVIDNPGVRAAYRRIQRYFYVPIGVLGQVPLDGRLSLLLGFEYRFMIYGHHFSGTKRVGFDRNLRFKQDIGYGGRVSLGVLLKRNLRVQAYTDFWFVDDSNVVWATNHEKKPQSYHEPRNNTFVFGASFGYGF